MSDLILDEERNYQETVEWIMEFGVDRKTVEMSLAWARPASPVTREALAKFIRDSVNYNLAVILSEGEADFLAEEFLRFRRPSPVTREALEGFFAEYEQIEFDGRLVRVIGDEAEVAHDVLSRFSLPEPAEVEWEYGEFSKDDIQEDGSIHPWAEPIDTWETPPTGDDLIDLADVGSVCARRMTTSPWVPVSPESEGKK